MNFKNMGLRAKITRATKGLKIKPNILYYVDPYFEQNHSPA